MNWFTLFYPRDNEEILQYFPNLKNYFKNINESSSNQESPFVDQDGLNFIENIHVQKDRVESLVLKSRNNSNLENFLYNQNTFAYKTIKLTLNQNQWHHDDLGYMYADLYETVKKQIKKPLFQMNQIIYLKEEELFCVENSIFTLKKILVDDTL